MTSLLPLFCCVDDFCQVFLPRWKAQQLANPKRRNRARRLSESESITILIAFHQSGYRTFKHFYLNHVAVHLADEFPTLVSYNRFIEYLPSVIVPLFMYLRSCYGKCTGIAFLDSTALTVCENPRIAIATESGIAQHKVFADCAKRGKTSTGWFFGFKLHLVINDKGEILSFTTAIENGIVITTADVHDTKPVANLLQELFGKVFADKGYISQKLHEELLQRGITLMTKARKNMKPRDWPPVDKLLLRKRAIIEAVNDQRGNISQVEHTRHRAKTGFLWNVAAARAAYCHQPKKPSLNRGPQQGAVVLA